MRARDRFCGSCGTPLDGTTTVTSRLQTSASLQVATHRAGALGERLAERDRARFTWREEDGGEFGHLRVGYYDLGVLRTRADT